MVLRSSTLARHVLEGAIMFRRSVPLVVALALSTSACTMTSSGKAGTILGGVAMGAVGVTAWQFGPVDSDGNGTNDWILNDNLGAYFAGSLLITGGIALLIAGITAQAVDEAPASLRTPASPATGLAAPVAASHAPAPVAVASPGTGSFGFVAPASATPPAEASQPARLPELPASIETLRLAKQVRVAASHDRCDHAWSMWLQLRDVDPSYARALRDSPVMAPCLEVAAQ